MKKLLSLSVLFLLCFAGGWSLRPAAGTQSKVDPAAYECMLVSGVDPVGSPDHPEKSAFYQAWRAECQELERSAAESRKLIEKNREVVKERELSGKESIEIAKLVQERDANKNMLAWMKDAQTAGEPLAKAQAALNEVVGKINDGKDPKSGMDIKARHAAYAEYKTKFADYTKSIEAGNFTDLLNRYPKP